MTYIIQDLLSSEIVKVEAVSKEEAFLLYLRKEFEYERKGLEDICGQLEIEVQNLDEIVSYE